ncbi:spore germination protein [Paenibacillus albus]|uniref:spore germination protein n=1 Tax=Paenibacillus albus TaxID=2495582 RepID=UPI0013DFCD83|nr:spore germination protein [Paenibacillus albus]
MKQLGASPIPADLESAIHALKAVFESESDIQLRPFRLLDKNGCILYHVAFTNKSSLQSQVLKPLLTAISDRFEDVLPVLSIERVDTIELAAAALLQGKCAILLEGLEQTVLADVSVSAGDSGSVPQNEQTIRGSHEGFVDDLFANRQLIRRRLETPDLTERSFVLGTKSPYHVSLLYISGLADDAVVEQISTRIEAVTAKYVKSEGQIADILETSRWSLFPQMLSTERPDTTVSHLMEGRIVVLADGNASAFILPATFFMFFQVPDDFVLRWWNGSFFRFLRYISVLITVALPSIYIAIVSNHFEVLPIDLVFSLKASLENIPFNPLIEALFMITVLELLREAALRLPKAIASTLSIVGGLVIGTEVVNANLVSTTMIVVIALTAVASFSIPSHEMRLALRLVSIPVMFAAVLLGFVGIAFSFSLLFMHLTKLETYGVPYFYPLTPLEPKRLWPAILQLPRKLFRRG